MRSAEDVKAELGAHLADLERFEAQAADYVPGTPEEQKAHDEDVAKFREIHAERVAVLKAELA